MILALKRELLSFVADEIGSRPIQIGTDLYHVVGEAGDGWGFYDFLRTKAGKLIGVRYNPLIRDTALQRDMVGKTYARLLSNGSMEFYFHTDRDFVMERSCDQDFLGNDLYRSVSGEYAVTFVIDGLELGEQRQLRSIAEPLKLTSPGF